MTDTVQVDAQRGWRMLLRRTAALLAGETAARAIGFAVVVLLARRLGPSGFGVVTLGLTLVTFFAYIVDSGTELLNVREVARTPSRFREIAEQMLGLRLMLSVVAAVVFIAGVEIVAKSPFTRDTVVLFAIILPAIALNLRWMALGVGGSRAIAAGNIASRLVVLLGALLLVSDSADLKRVPFLEAAAELAYGLIVLSVVGGSVGVIRPRANLAVWRSTLRQSVPFTVGGVARAMMSTFDIIVISLVLGPRDVGIYGVAAKPALFAAGAVALFSLSFLSAFSATAVGEAALLHGRALRTSFLACVGMAAVLCAAAPLVPLVFGESYRDAVPVVAVIAWRIPVAVLGLMYSSVLIAHDRQTTVMRNSVVAVVPTITFSLVAILLFGLIGAAVASIAAAGLLFVLNYRSVMRYEPTLRVATMWTRSSSGTL